MKFYVGVGFLPPQQSFDLMCELESLGFHGVTLGDHLALAEEPASPYPSESGRPSFPIDTPWLDPWVVAGALATATTSLRLLTTIYLLPLRHPLQVAKAVATAHILGGGRVELGIGVGWQTDEFVASGIDFHTRGARTDEMIDALRALWAPGAAVHSGKFFELSGLITEPTLDTPPPVLVGGSSPAAYRRAARLGDGFITMPTPSADLPAAIATLRQSVADEGRDPKTFSIYANSNDARTPTDYARLAEMGVDVALVRPANMSNDDNVRDRLSRFADEVLAELPAGVSHPISTTTERSVP